MITPADIENKEFKRSHRGYDEQEVDEYLDLIIIDMEKLIKENKELKAQLANVDTKVEKGSNTENSVYETLEAAKALMNDIAASAERRAEVLLKNAELDADLITREAKENVSKYTEEGTRLKERVTSLRDRYKKMLEAEMERMDYFTDDFIKEFEKDFLREKSADDSKVAIEKIETTSTVKKVSSSAKEDLSKTTVVPKVK